MIARAPGKLVLSGAYSVLEGAPALVAAVDRYVIADGSRTSALVTEEILAAMSQGALDRVPWFDASQLRARLPDGTTRKLGLGSSGAILVASIASVIAEQVTDEVALRDAVFRLALAAHRQAQPLGSGIEIPAITYGGIVRCHLRPAGGIETSPYTLPAGLSVEVFACESSASTGGLLEKVLHLRETDETRYRSLIEAAATGARSAISARDAESFVHALSFQTDALSTLGRLAQAPIVINEVAELRGLAAAEQANFGPSGAGGGDIALWVGTERPSDSFLARAASLGLEPLPIALGAPGVKIL